MEKVLEGSEAVMARSVAAFLVDAVNTVDGNAVCDSVSVRVTQVPMPPVVLESEVVFQFGGVSVATTNPTVLRLFRGQWVTVGENTIRAEAPMPVMLRIPDGVRFKWETMPEVRALWGLSNASVMQADLFRDRVVIRAHHALAGEITRVIRW